MAHNPKTSAQTDSQNWLQESASQYASESSLSTSYRTPTSSSEPDNDLEFEEPKKIPEIELYYKPLPKQVSQTYLCLKKPTSQAVTKHELFNLFEV
jgi:hypothetical protein